MPRSLSLAAVADMFSQEVGVAYLVLVTITHPDLTETLRVTSDNVDTISRGNTFVSYPFNLAMPTDTPDAPPRTVITIDNVSRKIADALRSIVDAAKLTIECVRSTALDTVEFSYDEFLLTNVKGDVFQVSGDLGIEDITAKPFPAKTYNPARFQGLV